MTPAPITSDSTVAEALQFVPGAIHCFERHGVNPHLECGMMAHMLTLDSAASKCRLGDVDGLVEELNAACDRETR